MTGFDLQESLRRRAPSQDPQPPRLPSFEIPPGHQSGQAAVFGDAMARRGLMRNLMESMKVDPDLRAEVHRLKIETGLDHELIERNFDKIRELARRKEIERQELVRDFPILAQHLQDPEFAKIAHDDLERLGFFESTIGSLHAGMLEREQMHLEHRIAEGRGDRPAIEARIEAIERQLRGLPVTSGPFGEAARIVGQIAPAIPDVAISALQTGLGTGLTAKLAGPAAPVAVPAAAFGGLAGGAAAGVLRESYVVNRGATFRELRELGIDEVSASRASAVAAVPMAMLDVVGATIATAPVRLAGQSVLRRVLRQEIASELRNRTLGQAGARFVGGTLAAATGEALTEALQEIPPEIAAQLLADTPLERARLSQRDPLLARMADVGSRVFQGMLVLGGLGAGSRFAVDASRVREAQGTMTAFDNLMQGAETSKLRERSPAAFEAFASATVEGKPAENVYIEGARLSEVLQQSGLSREQLGEVLPEAAEQLPQTIETGGDVVIPTGEYAAKVAGTDFGQVLQQHVRLDPNAPSVAEMQQVQQAAAQVQKETAETVERAVRQQAEFTVSSRRVREGMLEQVQATERRKIGPREARIAAELYRTFVETQAARLGILPEQFDRERGLRVVAGERPPVEPEAAPARPDVAPPEPEAPPVEPAAAPAEASEGRIRARETRLAELLARPRSPELAKKSDTEVMRSLQGVRGNVREGISGEQERVDAMETEIAHRLQDASRAQRETLLAALEAEPGTLRQEGPLESRGAFDPSRMTAILFQKADLSSFLHESAHYFLTVYADIATQPNAPQQIVDDMATFLEWVKVDSLETWNSLSLEQQRKHHETFALSFEVYAFEGKAPSRKLKRLFDRFRRWLTGIYDTIRGELNADYRAEFGEDLPILTDEIRGVMDRMLASDAAVQQAEAVRGFAPMFESQEQSGLSDERWAQYQERLEEEREAALSELAQRSLGDMQWLTGAQGRVLKELQRRRREARRKVQAEATAQVDQEPVYRALRFLRQGEHLTVTGAVEKAPGAHKLDRDLVQAIVPNVDLRRFGVGRSSILSAPAKITEKVTTGVAEGALHPDVVADLFGFESGAELLQAILAAPDRRTRIAEVTDQRMLEEHSDLTDPVKVQAMIERALHTQARARLLATELSLLEGATRPSRVVMAAAREAAERAMGAMPIRRIRPQAFAAAERRARRRAEDAGKKGLAAEAREAKQEELLQNQIAAVALDARETVEKARIFFRVFRKPDRKLARARNVDMIGAGRAILFAHELGPPATQQAPHLENVENFDKELYDDLWQRYEEATRRAQPWQSLSFEDFQIVEQSVRAIWDLAKRDRTIEFAGQQEEREAVIAKVLASFFSIMEKRGIDPDAPRGEAITKAEKRRLSFGNLKAMITHMESWAIEMDGGTTGNVHKYLVALLREPFDRYMLERNEIIKEISDRAAALKLGPAQKIRTDLGVRKRWVFDDQRQLIGALLHIGNESNLRKFLLGRELVAEPEQAGGLIDTTPWWDFFDQASGPESGLITKEIMDFVQHVWDTFEGLWERTQREHMAVYGYRAPKLEVRPVQTPWGEYRGGYFPAKADVLESVLAGKPTHPLEDEIVSTSREFKGSILSTGRGHTLQRVEANRPLLLDLKLVGGLLDDHLRFIHLQRPGRDMLKILKDERVGAAIDAINPNARRDFIDPWLRDTLQNRVMQSTGSRPVDSFLSFVRRNTGTAIMFANVRVAAQQVTGIANTLAVVQTKYVRGALAQWFRNPHRMVQDIMAASDAMRVRLEHATAQIVDDADTLFSQTWFGRAQEWTRKHGFFLQRMFQTPVDLVTWAAAHDQATAGGRSTEEAIRHADAIVRRTQASGLAPDISRLERGSALVRLATQFNSYWLVTTNLVMGMRDMPLQRARAIGLVLSIVGIGGGAIAKALEGGWNDDDEDGVMWDDMTQWLFAETMHTAITIGIPVVGPAVSPAFTGEFGGRINFGAGMSTANNAIRSSVGRLLDPGRETRGGEIKGIANLLTLITGLPFSAAARPVVFEVESERRDAEPLGPLDYVRGLITGRVNVGAEQ